MQRVKIQRVAGKMTPRQKELAKREAAAAARQMPRLRKLAAAAGKSRPVQILVSNEIYSALREHCDAEGEKLSDFLRTAALEKLGRTDLLETMRKNGRPAKC